ncbi:MAG: cytochrome c3 family protein [Desulforhopalus sp.]
MKWFFTKLYILAFMGLTVFFSVLIWNLTFAHLIHEYHARKGHVSIEEARKLIEEGPERQTFEQIILESEDRVKHYLGYRVLEEQRIEGHFHHIGLDIGPDNRSYCRSCHGDMPHDSVKDIRSFLNMHAFFVACQTCHVKLKDDKKTNVFKWYDRKTGELADSPVNGAPPGTYNAKVIPFIRENGRIERIDSQDRIDFVRDYRLNERSLSEGQKSKAKKIIHKIISKTPVMCEECHTSEKALLPLAELGYPKARIDSITSTEVVGMIKNYTKFYMPKILSPGDMGGPTVPQGQQLSEPRKN